MFGRSRRVLTAPEGREWTVGVPWLPRRPRRSSAGRGSCRPSADDKTLEWQVIGWRASRDFAAAVAIRLERDLGVDDSPLSSHFPLPGAARPGR